MALRDPEGNPETPTERRARVQRETQLRQAKAKIYLACEEAGPHMAVLILNNALREQLDKLRAEPC